MSPQNLNVLSSLQLNVIFFRNISHNVQAKVRCLLMSRPFCLKLNISSTRTSCISGASDGRECPKSQKRRKRDKKIQLAKKMNQMDRWLVDRAVFCFSKNFLELAKRQLLNILFFRRNLLTKSNFYFPFHCNSNSSLKKRRCCNNSFLLEAIN